MGEQQEQIIKPQITAPPVIMPPNNNDNNNIEENTEQKEKTVEDMESEKINWRDGISIYEGKMSVLIIGTMITLLFSLGMYAWKGDISNNLTLILQTFIISIAGVNAATGLLSAFKK